MVPPPVHDPRFTVTVEPSTIEPETLGRCVFTGARGLAFTAAFACEEPVWDPTELVPVTRSRMRQPTSAETRTYVVPVAPVMLRQLLPSGAPPSDPHRTHWYANVIGWVPVHAPAVPVSRWPSVGVPEIAGSPVFFGAPLSSVTTEVASDRAEPEPSAFDAVTRTRIRAPTSAFASTCVVSVAVEIGVQLAPALSQRCHSNVKLIG